MNRAGYHREYYARTLARRRQYARNYKQGRFWARWLLIELGIAPEQYIAKHRNEHPTRH